MTNLFRKLFGVLILTALVSICAAQDYEIAILKVELLILNRIWTQSETSVFQKARSGSLRPKPFVGKSQSMPLDLVVSPGFIDLHQHGQDSTNYRFKAMDGVTSALELELGTADIDRWYAEHEGKALINYGASIGHVPIRRGLMHDPGDPFPTADAANRQASEAEIIEIKRQVERGLSRGAPAVGLGIQYTPAASRTEILEIFRTAARFGAFVDVHLRYSGLKEPTSGIAALQEVLADAAATGAALHVDHVTSHGLRSTPALLQLISDARSRGLDVTTECYPYTAGATGIESAYFSEGWREALGIDYKDLQWAATGERLTAESFAKYRKTGGRVFFHFIPEEVVQMAVANPLTMIASDGRFIGAVGHPRTAGTYARVLGVYVREQKSLTLMEALRKMTLMPAQRLESRVPMMKLKGRIAVGADADLAIFDPNEVIDRATYEKPAAYSGGIKYVLVKGVLVVKGGQIQESTAPGKAIRAPVN